MDDLARLRQLLAPIAERAQALPWADKRPWRTRTHVSQEGDLLVVDLHDLSVAVALAALDLLVDHRAELRAGAVALVTGVGRHSQGPPKLRAAVGERAAARGRAESFEVRNGGAGRLLLLFDPRRVPQAGQPSSPLLLLLAALLVLAAGVALGPWAALLLALLLFALGRSWR